MSSACPPVATAASGGAGALPTEDGPGPRPSLLVAAPGDAESARPVLCHYCKVLPGSTKDHVVPRTRLNRATRMLGGYVGNSVPACTHCNGRKGSSRVECCPACYAKWEEHGPADWEITVPVLSLIYVTKVARALARQ